MSEMEASTLKAVPKPEQSMNNIKMVKKCKGISEPSSLSKEWLKLMTETLDQLKSSMNYKFNQRLSQKKF